MPNHAVCDIDLCDELKRSMRMFFRREPSRDPEEGPIVVKVVRKNRRKVEELRFRYCPYCGTRLAAGVVDTIEA